MKKMKKKFRDLPSLRAERMRLQRECQEKEAELTAELQYIQDHFGMLVLTSLLPFKRQGTDGVGNIFGKIGHLAARVFSGDGDKLGGQLPVALKIVQMVLAGLVYRYIRRFFRR